SNEKTTDSGESALERLRQLKQAAQESRQRKTEAQEERKKLKGNCAYCFRVHPEEEKVEGKCPFLAFILAHGGQQEGQEWYRYNLEIIRVSGESLEAAWCRAEIKSLQEKDETIGSEGGEWVLSTRVPEAVRDKATNAVGGSWLQDLEKEKTIWRARGFTLQRIQPKKLQIEKVTTVYRNNGYPDRRGPGMKRKRTFMGPRA
ncbi:hypothetical protein JCM24511_00001, partial [Saitozyma sp. JCM 24511]